MGRCVATPHGREWTRPLRVLLAAQCPLQMNPITRYSIRYIHMAIPHVSYSLHYAILFSSLKIFPSLTEDINPQSSNWNNGKIKIAYKSTFVQIETFNFTFAQQSLIVYFHFCSNFPEITICRRPNIKLRNAYCRRVQVQSRVRVKFGMLVDLKKSQPKDEKLSLKGRGYVT